MKKMNIGAVIAKSRKAKGVTQEELAKYLGVSKPAVSKWESGQSYPDIMLLPVIASYFDLSVDTLLGYEAQMSSEDIKKTYLMLAAAFSKEPFDTVYAECKDCIKSYYSCWELLFSMAQLLLNHAPLAGSPQRVSEMMQEIIGLYERIEQESGDAVLSRQALTMRAFCYLTLQQPAEAIDLLDNILDSELPADMVLAKAYAQKGDLNKAKSIVQTFVYKNLVSLFGALIDLMYYDSESPDKMEDCLQKALDLGDIFELKAIHPALYFSAYLTAATLFAAQNQDEKAINSLQDYAQLVSGKDVFPLRLKGNAFFDLLEPYFDSLNLGAFPPRDEKLILKDIKSSVLENPVFERLKTDERFKIIAKKLEGLEEKNDE